MKLIIYIFAFKKSVMVPNHQYHRHLCLLYVIIIISGRRFSSISVMKLYYILMYYNNIYSYLLQHRIKHWWNR